MTSDCKKPGVAFWATVVVVVVSSYFASVGPLYWTASRIPATNTYEVGHVLDLIYWPIWKLPPGTSARRAFEKYVRAGTAPESFIE